jgi:hypothetical protein
MYTGILKDGSRYINRFWTNTAADPRVGYWGTGRSDEPGVRSITCIVLANGALLKYCDVLTGADRNECTSKTFAALRYLTSTHVTGTKKCTDGKTWGNSWQSALWTANFAFGAWLIWDELDAQLRKDVERVIVFESDRFLKTKPPGGSFNDTKAEENGWNLTCIATAVNMFPNHPHHSASNQKAIEYMMNTLSAPQDGTDPTIVDRRPVRDWFSGANVHSDFTLENHGFFHPSYIACSSYFLTQTAMYYTYAHQPVPQAVDHHLPDTWRLFQKFILPNGEAAYPQGMDWELHNLPYLNLYASLATYKKDPLAAELENQSLQYFRAWQQMTGDGSLTFPGSRFGFSRHACTIDQMTWSFLAHKIFGPSAEPMSAADAASKVDGVNSYDDVKIVTHRTDKKFVSFSWTNYVMGMLVPIGAGHEDNPDFTVPIRDGFIGSFDTSSKPTKPIVTGHSHTKTTNGFTTTGTVLLNGGHLKQTLRFSSIGEHAVVYEDRVVALTNITIKEERGIPLGIENDWINGGTRVVWYQKGVQTFDQNKSQPPTEIPSSWANINGRLGIVVISGSGISYNQARDFTPGISVRQDVLYGSYSNKPKRVKAGQEVVHRLAIVLADVSSEQTAVIARTASLKDNLNTKTLHFALPEGGSGDFVLDPGKQE